MMVEQNGYQFLVLHKKKPVLFPAVEHFDVKQEIQEGREILCCDNARDARGNETKEKRVRRIEHVSKVFLQEFGGVIERGVVEAKHTVWNLPSYERRTHLEIVEKLGGVDKACAPLARLFQLIKFGEDGPGLFKAKPNIVYSRAPESGILWAVSWSRMGIGKVGFYCEPVSKTIFGRVRILGS